MRMTTEIALIDNPRSVTQDPSFLEHRANTTAPARSESQPNPKHLHVPYPLIPNASRGDPITPRVDPFTNTNPYHKDAGGFDLSIALGLLLGSGQVALDCPGSFAVVGELALTGEMRQIKGPRDGSPGRRRET
jgi:hypothetical protein